MWESDEEDGDKVGIEQTDALGEWRGGGGGEKGGGRGENGRGKAQPLFQRLTLSDFEESLTVAHGHMVVCEYVSETRACARELVRKLLGNWMRMCMCDYACTRHFG